jgi:hypothetical protein
MCFTYICCAAKSTHYIELDFGYVVDTSMCKSCAKICTKLLKESLVMIYLVFIPFLLI